jgi:hypothetical protein
MCICIYLSGRDELTNYKHVHQYVVHWHHWFLDGASLL